MLVAKTVGVLLLALALFSPIALASLGMSSGMLDFGKVARGGEKTLSFVIVNGASEPIKLEASMNGDLKPVASVSPVQATVGGNSQVILNVTVRMPRDIEAGTPYTGYVWVSTEPLTKAEAEGVGAILSLAARKEARAEAGEEVAPLAELPWALIAGGLALTTVAAIVVARKVWKKREE